MRQERGFTLVELLVVIGVMSVLATSVYILINPVAEMQKARDAERKTDMLKIQAVLEQYRADAGSYPTSSAPAGQFPSSCGANKTLTYNSVTYMQNIPCDPKTGGIYGYSSTGTTYSIFACLEYTSDPDKDATTQSACTTGASKTYTNP